MVDSSSWLVGGSSALLLTELLPGAEEAMALRITRNTKINAENKAKISMAGAKRVPVASVATSKPGLRPRTALGDIGNKVSEQPQAKLPLKKEAKTLAAGKVTAKKVPKPLEKAPVPVPEPQPEPEPELEPVKEEKLSPEPILVDTPLSKPHGNIWLCPCRRVSVSGFLRGNSCSE